MATTAPPASCSVTPTAKKCLNSECSEFRIRKGWRLRSGDFADLCDRCASTFEEGRFCDTFHLNATGWRSCESCGKRVHCGCIVSIHAFMLLDAGGIECIGCARKSFVPPSTPWPPPLFYNSPLSERFKDLHVKNWTQLAGSGPVPWRQAPSFFNSSISHSEMHPRTLYEMDRLAAGERSYPPSLEKGRMDDFSERFINGSLKPGSRDIHEKGNAGTDVEEKAGSCLSVSHQPSLKEDPSNPQRTAMSFASLSEPNNVVSGTPLRQPAPPSVSKQFHGSLHNGVDSPAETHIRNGRPRADARARSQLLPRYWPRFTDEELQQISGNSNSVITPLFEKMLSASDAGRIGRLVLPKKCAEAYFPPISNPEGLPLKVQDSKGREWIFQFRFWPNNNSRMYVLEGVTPCIQNMRLQAGDIGNH